MYQVITMYGDNEPWWFMDGWQEDIIDEVNFEDFEEAKAYFKKLLEKNSRNYPEAKVKDFYQAAFWKDGEYSYCEDCEEDLQQYKGLLITYNCQKIVSADGKGIDETTNNSGKAKCCQRFGKGIRRNAENKNTY